MVMDGVVLLQVLKMQEAAEILISSYYIFNVKYPKTQACTDHFRETSHEGTHACMTRAHTPCFRC